MTSMLEEELIGMNFKSANNSYHRIKALKKGKTVVNATLYGVKVLEFSCMLKFLLMNIKPL